MGANKKQFFERALSKAAEMLKAKRYVMLFIGSGGAAALLFFLLTILFPQSRFLLFNYFLKNAIEPTVFTIIAVLAFSAIFGFATAFTAYHFRQIINKRKKLLGFLAIAGILFIISYMLMLSSTSQSLFSYTEMNGFYYTLISLVLLAFILPLSSVLIINMVALLRSADKSISGAGGLLSAGFSLGCPTCGSLLLPLLGVTAGLAIFPLGGLELKFLSLGLLVFAAYKLKPGTCNSITPENNTVGSGTSSHTINKTVENGMLIALVLLAGIVLFNQLQIWEISSAFNPDSGIQGKTGIIGSTTDLSGVDVSSVNSTALAVATVFPELKNTTNKDDIVNLMLSTGTPEYSEKLGGISFDDPVTSLEYLSKWYYSLSPEIEQNNPQVWQRYLNLAAAPRGISCEFCCGVGPQGVSADGKIKCGCKHNPALLALTLGLMKNTDYSDAEVLREVMKWKTMFFPKNMIALGIQVAGQDPSQLKDLPGMVGGC